MVKKIIMLIDKIGYACRLYVNGQDYESICKRCGRCCGSMDDPCEDLITSAGRYLCIDYQNRFGLHRSINGTQFYCMEIKNLIKNGTAPLSCAYVERPKVWPC